MCALDMNCMSKEEASQLFMQSSALLPSPCPTLKVLPLKPMLYLSQNQSLLRAAGVSSEVAAEVTGDSVELSVTAAVTVRLDSFASGLVTSVVFGLSGGTRPTLSWLNCIWDISQNKYPRFITPPKINSFHDRSNFTEYAIKEDILYWICNSV